MYIYTGSLSDLFEKCNNNIVCPLFLNWIKTFVEYQRINIYQYTNITSIYTPIVIRKSGLKNGYFCSSTKLLQKISNFKLEIH